MEQPARIAHPVRLDDLIDAIKVVHTDALDQLTDAILAAEHNDIDANIAAGRVFRDCYRDLVSNVVLMNPRTGEHLARWNL